MKKNCSTWKCRRPALIGVRDMKSQFCHAHLDLFLNRMGGGYAPLSQGEVDALRARLAQDTLASQEVRRV